MDERLSRRSFVRLAGMALAGAAAAACGATPTATPLPPTPTTKLAPANTPAPPTATKPAPTNTPLPPTATKPAPTNTPVPPTATPAPPAAPVKLQLGGWGGAESEKLYQSLIKAFKTKYPTYDVELVSTPDFVSYLTKMQTLMAGGSAPDVMDLGNEWYAAFVAKGAFIDLTPFIQADSDFKLDAYFPAALAPLTFDNKLYALPKDIGVNGLFYNKKLFDKAGVKYPDNTWKWADLLAAAQKLTIRDAASGRVTQYGWSDSGQNMWDWIWQNGGSVFDDEAKPTKCTFNSAVTAEAMQFYIDLSLKHKVAPTLAELQQTPFRDLFMSGRVAMIYDTAAAQSGYKTIKDFEWGVSEEAMGKQRAVGMVENGWAITAFSKKPKESWLLAKFLSGPEGATIVTTGQNSIPALKALTGNVAKPFIDSLAYARPMFRTPKLLEIYAIFQAEYPAGAIGAKPMKDTLDALCAKIDPVLAAK